MRSRRGVVFFLLLVVSWCVMVTVHEAGHIVCGWLGGGTLQHAELAPWTLPHSHFDPDPYPLLTLWGGPVLGVLVPLGVAALVRHPWTWFIGWFCVLANGCYLALAWASGDRHLDTARLLQHGTHPALIALYCTMTLIPGYVGFRRQCVEMLSPDDPDSHSRSSP